MFDAIFMLEETATQRSEKYTSRSISFAGNKAGGLINEKTLPGNHTGSRVKCI